MNSLIMIAPVIMTVFTKSFLMAVNSCVETSAFGVGGRVVIDDAVNWYGCGPGAGARVGT